MAKLLKCSDVGPDCDYTAWAETEEEMLEMVRVHARDAHGIEEIDGELLEKVREAMTEV